MTASIRRHPRRSAALAIAGAVALIALVVSFTLLGRPPETAALPSASPSPSPVPSASPSVAPSPSISPTPSPSPTPTPTPLPSGVADLTGLHVDDALAHRLPIAVMIDDNRIARPQSGFNAASIVYQAPADGGETRYMLVFQEGDSKEVGPVRSARLYFVHWVSELRGAIAHYGGDKLTREYLVAHDRTDFTDVDALRTISTPFHRISTRRAPHNAYTRTAALRAALRKLGGPATMPIDRFRHPFVDAAPLADRALRETITIPYQTGLVGYAYDRADDVYRRLLDRRVQRDPADNRPVTTTNVVVLFMPFRIDSTIERGHARPVLGDIGSGKALIFREGHVVVGSWRKDDAVGPTHLLDATGVEVPLVRGRTFFQIVPLGTRVAYTPGA
jgi:hypothetical protein